MDINDMPSHTFDVPAILTLSVRRRHRNRARHLAKLFDSADFELDVTGDIPRRLAPGSVVITCISARGDVVDADRGILPDPAEWEADSRKLGALQEALRALEPFIQEWEEEADIDNPEGSNDGEHEAAYALVTELRSLLKTLDD